MALYVQYLDTDDKNIFPKEKRHRSSALCSLGFL